MDPRAFLQFCNDARLLAEDFTYGDAEDICSKLVEDGCDRFDIEHFTIALAKICWYKYKLAPVDTAETFIEDHILPLEREAQEFLVARPWEKASNPYLKHGVIPQQELLHRCYLFYTEEGQPMFFEDFKLFAQDFGVVEGLIGLQELRQLYAQSPREWMSLQDFVALIQACAAHGEVNPLDFLDDLSRHTAMAGVIQWFDAQTNGLPVEIWQNNPQQSMFEPYKPYLDPARKDGPMRLTDQPYLKRHADEVQARPFDSELLPVTSQENSARPRVKKPWDTQLEKRNRIRNRRIRGVVRPKKKAGEGTMRPPSPYVKDPKKEQQDETEAVLEEFCDRHRVDLQLLFDTYGVRDFKNPTTGEVEGIMTGAEFHRLIWDAGMLQSAGHGGLHDDVNGFFKECVGVAYREGMRLSYDRFKVALCRTAELMSRRRNRVQEHEHIVDAVRDLCRDYLTPLCHANFWKEASDLRPDIYIM